MAEILILGSANAVPDAGHDYSHLCILHGSRKILVDTGSSPMTRLLQNGIEPNEVTDLILTHFHPDHCGALPAMMLGMWLTGRKMPLAIHGLPDTLDRAEAMMGLFGWKGWKNRFEVHLNRQPEAGLTTLLETAEIKIQSTPVKHLIPTIGLRFEFLPQGSAAAYTCDTEPCPQLLDLANRVDLLIHESAGDAVGHSSACQAAATASQAGAETLVLIHYPRSGDPHLMVKQARQGFSGKVMLAEDGMRFTLD